MRLRQLSGKDVDVPAAAVDRLRAAVRGELLSPGVPGYEDARRGFNYAIDRRPGLVLRCQGAADVVHGVAFAKEHQLLNAVKGGGHDVAGLSICDGGLVLDLSRMRSVHVDHARRTARIEAGATWGDVDRETQLFGLATPGGTVSKVGVAGFTLGGGIGWLGRSYGLACDNLLAVDIVTADGKLRSASPAEEPELFWALRGGGGNCGVVVSLELQLHEVKSVYGGLIIFPIARAREILEQYRLITQMAPDELTAYATLLVHPEAGPVCAVAACYNGNAVEGQDALAALKAKQPMVDALRPLTYLELQGMLDPTVPPAFHHSWRAGYLQSLSDKAIATLVEQFATATVPGHQILIEHLGGAIERVGRDESAYVHRGATFSMLVMGAAPDAAAAKAPARWVRNVYEAMRPLLTEGVYVNYLGHEPEESARLPSAYDVATLQRLAAVKQRIDPSNLFRHNRNVAPQAAPAKAGDGDATELRRQLEALMARFDALEDRVNEIEFETTLSDKPKKPKPVG